MQTSDEYVQLIYLEVGRPMEWVDYHSLEDAKKKWRFHKHHSSFQLLS